jgi:hypothetical protein
MIGYIISDKENINVKEHEIKSFNILNNTNLNIFVIENNRVLYKNNIIVYSCIYLGHIEVLEWFKNSGYEINYTRWEIRNASICNNNKVLEFFKNRNIKKIIKWSNFKFNKTIKYKTKNNYLKGYNKN